MQRGAHQPLMRAPRYEWMIGSICTHVREIDTVGYLWRAVVCRLHTDDGEFVTNLQTQCADETLTGIACGAPARIAAVDIQTVVTILQVDVAVSVVGNLVEGTSDHVVDILIVGFREELGDGDWCHHVVKALEGAFYHLRRVFVSSALTYDGHDITNLGTGLDEAFSTIDECLTRVIGNIEALTLLVTGIEFGDDTSEAILCVAYFGSEEVGDWTLDDGTLLASVSALLVGVPRPFPLHSNSEMSSKCLVCGKRSRGWILLSR